MQPEVATFLFSDMEGSTLLWERAPAQMGAVMARHDSLLTEIVRKHDGEVFKSTGDGLAARFTDPGRALAAAVAMQRGIAEEPWLVGPIRIRVGVHTGPAAPRDNDWYGPAVNRAARLCHVAHGGQTITSAATGSLAPDSDVSLSPLGEHLLRDVAEPIAIHQVDAAGVAVAFPPLRTTHVEPRGLPIPESATVGRADDRHRLTAALRDNRLVTVTGPPGVGKSTLAFGVVWDERDHWPGGVWCSEVESVSPGRGAVASNLARLLGSAAGDQGSSEDAILAALRPVRALVVLDGCEHVLDEAASLAAAIRKTCPETAVLVTSRSVLGVPGEVVVEVDGLPVDDAVELFRMRCARAGSVEVDRASAARLVERLDRLPLAIELAAVQSRRHHPDSIGSSIGVSSVSATAPGRRPTPADDLDAALAWSYDLLSASEQQVLRLLSMFNGWFTAERASAFVTEIVGESLDTVRSLDDLVGRSLLRADTREPITRYRMLQTVRRFGGERLVSEPGGQGVVRRFDAGIVASLVDAAMRLDGVDEARWVEAIEAMFDDVRAAHARAIDNGDVDGCISIVAALVQHATMRSTEIGAWARLTTEVEGFWDDERAPLVAGIAAEEAMRGGETTAALALTGCALEIADADNATPTTRASAWMARSTHALATLLSGQIGPGLRHIGALRDRSTDIADHDHFARAVSAYSESVVFTYGGDPGLAAEAVDRLVAISDETASPSIGAMARFCQGSALLSSSPGRAEALLQEALDLADSVANVRMANQARWALAEAAATTDPSSALRRLRAVLADVGREVDNAQQVLVRCLSPLVALGEIDDAALVAAMLDGTVWERSAQYVSGRARLDQRAEAATVAAAVERARDLGVEGVVAAVQRTADRNDGDGAGDCSKHPG